jgi:folate-binding protein YgfZ
MRAEAADYRAAREKLGHRVRPAAILDVEGFDRVVFLQGQLTQDVARMAVGQTLPVAGLNARGKLLYLGRVHALSDRLRLLLSSSCRLSTLEHLRKYAVFQKVSVADRSEELVRIGVYGPGAACLGPIPEEATVLPGEAEFAAEIVAPSGALPALEGWLSRRGSAAVSSEIAEALRVEAGRPRFGQDADASHVPDEVGLGEAISTTKGCYVGQEIVARMRTYGRMNRRLAGFRFPQGEIPAGAILKLPHEAAPGKVEQGRVTSAVLSPRLGAIGLGYAYRDVAAGGSLAWVDDPSRTSVVCDLPFG